MPNAHGNPARFPESLAKNRTNVIENRTRSHLGAARNRLETTVTNITIQAENLQNAESLISDVDVATEMTTFARPQILSQTAVSMLAQANSFPQCCCNLSAGRGRKIKYPSIPLRR